MWTGTTLSGSDTELSRDWEDVCYSSPEGLCMRLHVSEWEAPGFVPSAPWYKISGKCLEDSLQINGFVDDLSGDHVWLKILFPVFVAIYAPKLRSSMLVITLHRKCAASELACQNNEEKQHNICVSLLGVMFPSLPIAKSCIYCGGIWPGSECRYIPIADKS